MWQVYHKVPDMKPSSIGPSSGKAKVLMQRLASTVVLWSVVLAALFAPLPWLALSAFLVIMMGITVFGFLETQELLQNHKVPSFKKTGMVAACATTLTGFLVGTDLLSGMEWILIIPGTVVVVFLARGLLSENLSESLPGVAGTLFLWIYIPGLLGFLQYFYFHPDWQGPFLLLYFILIIKFSDVGGFCVGSLLGKHKMIPSISPGKTWEGFAGALLVPGLLSALIIHIWPDRMAWFEWPGSFLAGVCLGATAVVGDLVESAFKRGAGVKDSGHWFPGIGGVLDLVDSLLFAGPVMFVLLYLI